MLSKIQYEQIFYWKVSVCLAFYSDSNLKKKNMVLTVGKNNRLVCPLKYAMEFDLTKK